MAPPALFALMGLAPALAADCCWCDKATTAADLSTTGTDHQQYDLVFSDEFNEKGRNFENGKDSKWTGLTVGDTSNHGAAFYLPEQATVATDPLFPDVSALLITTVSTVLNP